MLVIGLTGSLATGKTTVARMFAEHGAKVLNADKIAHRLITSNGKCFTHVVRSFGKKILTKGRIDRSALAQIVFSRPRLLKRLERIIHPEVAKEIRKRIKRYRRSKKVKAVVLDVPLLFESGLDREADLVLAVCAHPRQQWARLVKKKPISKAEFGGRLKAQMPLKEKMALSDCLINNRGSLAQTRKQVDGIWQDIILKRKGKNS